MLSAVGDKTLLPPRYCSAVPHLNGVHVGLELENLLPPKYWRPLTPTMITSLKLKVVWGTPIFHTNAENGTIEN